jgi:hypothetical protein
MCMPSPLNALFFLVFLLEGKHHVNGAPLCLLSIDWIFGLIAAMAGFIYSLSKTHVTLPQRQPIAYSPVWIGML